MQGHIFLIDTRRTAQVYTGVLFSQTNSRGHYKFTWGDHIFQHTGCHKYFAQSIVYIFKCFINKA